MSVTTIGKGIILFDLNNTAPAATVHTDNGISGDGSLLSPIILGGNPLIQNTTVDLSHFDLNFRSTFGGGFLIFDVDASIGGLDLDVVDAANNECAISIRATQMIIASFPPSGIGMGFQFTGGQMQVFDNLNAVGFSKNVAILAANQLANGANYITTDCLSAFAGLHAVNQRLQTALSTTFTVYTVDTTHNQLLRVNPAIFLNALGGTTSIQVSLIYKDEGGTTRTLLLTTLVSLATPVIPAQVIYAQKNTPVQISVVLNLAGANYNCYATVDYLGVQNT